jgi:hypothetical protein
MFEEKNHSLKIKGALCKVTKSEHKLYHECIFLPDKSEYGDMLDNPNFMNEYISLLIPIHHHALLDQIQKYSRDREMVIVTAMCEKRGKPHLFKLSSVESLPIPESFSPTLISSSISPYSFPSTYPISVSSSPPYGFFTSPCISPSPPLQPQPSHQLPLPSSLPFSFSSLISGGKRAVSGVGGLAVFTIKIPYHITKKGMETVFWGAGLINRKILGKTPPDLMKNKTISTSSSSSPFSSSSSSSFYSSSLIPTITSGGKKVLFCGGKVVKFPFKIMKWGGEALIKKMWDANKNKKEVTQKEGKEKEKELDKMKDIIKKKIKEQREKYEVLRKAWGSGNNNNNGDDNNNNNETVVVDDSLEESIYFVNLDEVNDEQKLLNILHQEKELIEKHLFDRYQKKSVKSLQDTLVDNNTNKSVPSPPSTQINNSPTKEMPSPLLLFNSTSPDSPLSSSTSLSNVEMLRLPPVVADVSSLNDEADSVPTRFDTWDKQHEYEANNNFICSITLKVWKKWNVYFIFYLLSVLDYEGSCAS